MVAVCAAATNDSNDDFGGNSANEQNPLVQYIERDVMGVLSERIVLESSVHRAMLIIILQNGVICARGLAKGCGSGGILNVNLGSGDSPF